MSFLWEFVNSPLCKSTDNLSLTLNLCGTQWIVYLLVLGVGNFLQNIMNSLLNLSDMFLKISLFTYLIPSIGGTFMRYTMNIATSICVNCWDSKHAWKGLWPIEIWRAMSNLCWKYGRISTRVCGCSQLYTLKTCIIILLTTTFYLSI